MQSNSRLIPAAVTVLVSLLLTACPVPTSISSPSLMPIGLNVIGQTGTSISLSWKPLEGAASYTVSRSQTPGGPYTAAATDVTATSCTVSGLLPGTLYYFTVAAVDEVGGGGPPSGALPASTQPWQYWDGYQAFRADYHDSVTQLNDIMSTLPHTIPGATHCFINGVNGGSASLDLTVVTGTVNTFTLDYIWSDYRGPQGSTIDGYFTVTYSQISAGVFGSLSFSCNSRSGDVAFNCVSDGDGNVTGTYTVNYLGESHTYDIATQAEVF